MYDIIGDIHGHADALYRLLEKLGYARGVDGAFQHPSRQVAFVGDFVDRGPKIPEVLDTVRRMCDAGSAVTVMGNHEFNALAYHTPDPHHPNEYLRKHSAKNNKQHGETLEQLTEAQLQDYLAWFRTLPIWLDLEDVRVVHACWDVPKMAFIEAALEQHGGMTADFLFEATAPDTQLFDAIEDVLKGKEAALPEERFVEDKEGHKRRRVRVKWYELPGDNDLSGYSFPATDSLAGVPIPADVLAAAEAYPSAAPPVFIGHYWLQGDEPTRLAANVCCVDYSVARGGSLVAYRWDGEKEIDNDKFHSVKP